MTNQANQAFEKWFGEAFNDFQFNKTGMVKAYQAATQASESEINSLKQRVEELQAHNNQLCEALEKAYEKLKLHLSGSREYLGGIPTQVLFPMIDKALSSTPAQSLSEHDNAIYELISNELDKHLSTGVAGNIVRAMRDMKG